MHKPVRFHSFVGFSAYGIAFTGYILNLEPHQSLGMYTPLQRSLVITISSYNYIIINKQTPLGTIIWIGTKKPCLRRGARWLSQLESEDWENNICYKL